MWGTPFMAGVFIVKNNDAGRNIFREWMACYNPNVWTRDEKGAWKCTGKGGWSGEDYEQGAFYKNILPKYPEDIRALPWYVFHEIDCLNPHSGCWSIHIPGVIQNTRPNCMQSGKTIEGFEVAGVAATSVFVCLTLAVATCYMMIRCPRQ